MASAEPVKNPRQVLRKAGINGVVQTLRESMAAIYSSSGFRQQQTFHIRNGVSAKLPIVGKSLDKQFGRFLRKKRGHDSYAIFARTLGISASTLYRLETGEQSVTLGKMEDILTKLKAGVRDVFPE